MEIGLRVVRGPDWQWRNQDDGEGHCGTVTDIGKFGSKTSPEKTVIVQWDSGSRTNYRVGHQDKYDLRIFDNASIGIRHPNVICDNCKKRGIQGMRWKCSKCFDFDLCTLCYMTDKHDLSHQFMRYETSTSQGTLLTKRAGSVKIISKGIFKGATVVRGSDWEWEDQDGGAGKTGKVLELRGWDRESGSSVATVEWSATGTTNVYRVGHKGKVDLKYVQEGCGISYYRDHLSVMGLGENSSCYIDSLEEKHSVISSQSSTSDTPSISTNNSITLVNNTENINTSVNLNCVSSLSNESPTFNAIVGNFQNNLNIENTLANNIPTSDGSNLNTTTTATTAIVNNFPVINHLFSVGDKVKITLPIDLFKQMQANHGGWNFRMEFLIGKIGTIHRVTDKGDVRVQFDGPDNRWTIYPGALVKLSKNSFIVGDYVRVNSDEEVVKNLQKGHGEYSENMKLILGKICRISQIYGDGDLRVTYNGSSFTLNSSCCSNVPKHQADIHNTIAYHNLEDAAVNMVNQFKDLNDDNLKIVMPESPDQLVRDAAHGHLQAVKDILNKYPNIIDQKSSGKTALQVASHQGHLEIVRLLASLKANLEIQDLEGDTALHYSCFGNQPEVAELLIQKNSNINCLNKNGCSALHVAVNKQHVNCVKVLLKYKCDVNIQDSYGDTALHDIIGKEVNKESKQIIDLLLSTPSINLSIRNKRGFNILHHASLKGNSVATEKLIIYSPQLIDTKKDDGFSAFHLASLNGHKEVVKCLLQSRADKEIINNRRQTPLLLAVAQLHASIIELLVEKKANVNAFDEDGDTCLHLLLNDKLATSEITGINAKQASPNSIEQKDLKDCKQLLMISQNMPNEFVTNIRLIISSYLIQNGANLYSQNKHKTSCVDYVTDTKISDFLQKQYLALQPQNAPSVYVPVTQKKDKCKLCDDETATITFNPCQHKIVCLDCSIRLKRCIECNQVIKEKITNSGSSLSVNKSDFAQLLNKIQALEEAQQCSICMERKKDTAFQCGHIACGICALPLKACHICREKVVKRFKIYET